MRIRGFVLEVGPFYCPADKRVYIDLDFFDELASRIGAGSTPFTPAYVIAHEYGHQVQDQLGSPIANRGDRQGAESKAVRSRAPGRLLRGRLGRHAGGALDR